MLICKVEAIKRSENDRFKASSLKWRVQSNPKHNEDCECNSLLTLNDRNGRHQDDTEWIRHDQVVVLRHVSVSGKSGLVPSSPHCALPWLLVWCATSAFFPFYAHLLRSAPFFTLDWSRSLGRDNNPKTDRSKSYKFSFERSCLRR